MPFYFLRSGADPLEDAKCFKTKKDAIAMFSADAYQLAKYDQRHEASIHIAENIDEVAEYPDFVCSLGPRGGLKIERA